MKINQAVILAGGRGERLMPLTKNIPKPLVEINKVPFCDYLIQSFIEIGITKVLFLIGYKGELIKERYSNLNGLKTEFSNSDLNTQTGKRILNAYDFLDEFFLLTYCDNYWPIDLNSMLINYHKKNVPISTTVFSNKHGSGEYGLENNIKINSKGYVEKYDKIRKSQGLNGVDIGFFIINKKFLEISEKNLSFENDMLPKFIDQNNLAAFITDKQYYYITDLKCIKKFENVVTMNKFKHLSSNYFYNK